MHAEPVTIPGVVTVKERDTLPAHVKRGVAAMMAHHPNRAPTKDAERIVNAWRAGRPLPQYVRKFSVFDSYGTTPSDAFHVVFYHYSTRVAVVLRPVGHQQSPRVLFFADALSRSVTTRRFANDLARCIGVKFYAWRHDNTTWAAWKLDGDTFADAFVDRDSVIATAE